MAEKLEVLEACLEQFIENVRQLGVIVTDFQPQGQEVLNQKINSTITCLKDIENCKASVSDIHVPLEVFDYIDSGRNPQHYTKDCIEKSLMKNEALKGKIDVYGKFRQELMTQIGKVYPQQIIEYKQARGEL
uniref:mediator of RNA polymerase II transcription subunit 10-like n=1 Tax=Ciona intestinalis TaxID=7719 RepID=UPI000180BD3C|nr:mediator of RNA polymerase II transcription subunit 10-like [Ciona intestinalis]|eukprot:XP_009858943.1 mediator of RNA polymerase II transcription subunit 10-like [Ciona intestinalis]